jgi:branched-chain amino acid transport system substrate-binding protein
MNKGLRLRCLRWAFAVGTAWLAAGCSPGVPDVLKIGVAVNTSGTGGIRGQDLLNGAQLAAAELNSSGFKVDGRVVRVEIVAKDDKGDAQTAKQVAEGLMAEQVHAVIGHVNTRETQAALPVYAARGVPHLFSSTLKTLTSMGSGNTLRLVANDAVQARALASFASENLRAQRLVAVVETGSYGKDRAGAVRGRRDEPGRRHHGQPHQGIGRRRGGGDRARAAGDESGGKAVCA